MFSCCSVIFNLADRYIFFQPLRTWYYLPVLQSSSERSNFTETQKCSPTQTYSTLTTSYQKDQQTVITTRTFHSAPDPGVASVSTNIVYDTCTIYNNMLVEFVLPEKNIKCYLVKFLNANH